GKWDRRMAVMPSSIIRTARSLLKAIVVLLLFVLVLRFRLRLVPERVDGTVVSELRVAESRAVAALAVCPHHPHLAELV
ncbi:hypothetical protein, partial [Pseudomonas aeruginosa]|uniref:hypothetical protein n=1 Tax=Pseudomonas aeruginosa TaxID=287 RepID=UPI001E4E07E5